MSQNYTLKIENGKVPYLMRAGKDMVSAAANPDTAHWMIGHGKVTSSDEFPGYPICVDDKWFIAGAFEDAEEPVTQPEDEAAEKPKVKKKGKK